MKVVYRGNHRPSHSTETHVAASFEAEGHEVVRLQEDTTLWQDTVTACEGAGLFLWTTTYHFASQWSSVDVLAALGRLREMSVPSIAYHLDRFVGLEREAQVTDSPYFQCDLVVTADGGNDEAFVAYGVNHRWLPPGVYDAECGISRRELAYASRVAFVGTHPYPHPAWQPYRTEVIQSLQSRYGRNFRLWPRGGRPIRGKKLSTLYASVDVVVGDSCLSGGATHYWSDRVPETLGRGGFLIHPAVEGLEAWYEDGVDLVTYELGDIAGLHRKIDYYLVHADERHEIAAHGRATVLGRDTYRHRAQQLIEWAVEMKNTVGSMTSAPVAPRTESRCETCDSMFSNDCASCGRAVVELALCRGRVPLANTLQHSVAEPVQLYGLHFGMCRACGAAQVMDRIDPAVIFDNAYPYRSSVSASMVEHARELVDNLCITHALGPDDLVIEIGSNDGYLLKHYVNRGVPVLGIDPADGAVADANAAGVHTICTHFTHEYGNRYTEVSYKRQRATIVHANNVFAHVPDVTDILKGVREILSDDGVLIVETPYLRSLVDGLAFDTIYHEHVYAWSATAFTRACRRAGLSVIDAEYMDLHAGTLRFTVRRASAALPSYRLTGLLSEEHDLGIATPEYLREFAKHAAEAVDRIRETIDAILGQGKRLVAYGAAAKGVMLLSALGLTSNEIEYVVDSTEAKQGELLPGSAIPIVSPSRLHADPPDVVLILPWNWADEIVHKEVSLLERGVRFFVPLPEQRWVTIADVRHPHSISA